MNQIKIGKFISTCRKSKKLTQVELADKLGVTDKSVSNWENGRNMPDLSLFKSLCDILEININEFLNGEKIDNKDFERIANENINTTIEYAKNKIQTKNRKIGSLIVLLGLIISFMAMTIITSESSWSSIYAIIGLIISSIGIFKNFNKLNIYKRLLLNIVYFILGIILLGFINYINVIYNEQPPRFSYSISTGEKMTVYKNLMFNVYKINRDSLNEYIVVDTEKKYTENTVPNVPFNRNISGINNIIKYENNYIGNNSNTHNLINKLPLSEYGFTIEIDSKNFGLIVNYHITDWYINNNLYLEKCLIYNGASLFLLIDNLEYINFNFSGNKYNTKRENFEKEFPNYNEIKDKIINSNYFNEYIESKINDNDFITKKFNNLF